MHEQQNSMIPAVENEFNDTATYEEFEAAISELTPDERKELVKMLRRLKAERVQKHAVQSRV